jgi:hypothetical protein
LERFYLAPVQTLSASHNWNRISSRLQSWYVRRSGLGRFSVPVTASPHQRLVWLSLEPWAHGAPIFVWIFSFPDRAWESLWLCASLVQASLWEPLQNGSFFVDKLRYGLPNIITRSPRPEFAIKWKVAVFEAPSLTLDRGETNSSFSKGSTKFPIYRFGSLLLQEEKFHHASFLMILNCGRWTCVLTFWQDGRSEIRPSQSSREWEFKSDDAGLIRYVLSIQDAIRESGIPSGLEIGGGPLLFALPI